LTGFRHLVRSARAEITLTVLLAAAYATQHRGTPAAVAEGERIMRRMSETLAMPHIVDAQSDRGLNQPGAVGNRR
jgi:hypothetical protein